MTQIFDQSGRAVAATVLAAQDNAVVAVLDKVKDGYGALKLATRGKKRLSKPSLGELNKAKIKQALAVRVEFRLSSDQAKINLTPGQVLGVDQFIPGDMVQVSGLSKGKGFAGTIKRHGFSRGPASHGSHNIRQPGSIGAQQPQRVVRGKKMAGRMGALKVSHKNLKVLEVLPELNAILIKGSVPGPNKGLVSLRSDSIKPGEAADLAQAKED